MPALPAEIEELLAVHSGQPMDYLAIFMFLNTVAGGHYEERHSETAIRTALAELLAAGAIEAWDGNTQLASAIPGETACHFRPSSRHPVR